jgi:hypothetical protein
VDPGDAVVESEETSMDSLATFVLDLDGSLSVLVISLEKISS